MATDAKPTRHLAWWQYWPVVVAVGFSRFGGLFFARWMPAYYGVALAGFLGWFFAGCVWLPSMTPRFGMPRWLAPFLIGIAAGAATGLLYYFVA